MDKKILAILVVCIILIAAFLLHNYIFSIYETRVGADKDQLFADGSSQIQIFAIPVNGLGFRAPFRNPKATFIIEEGKDLVEILKIDEAAGVMILKAKYTAGKVVVVVRPKYALFPTKITILISQNVA